MTPHNKFSFLETPEQDVQTHLDGGYGGDLQFVLDRSCTPHCIEAIMELSHRSLETLDNVEQYINFLLENGADEDTGTSNSEIYSTDDGWYNTAIADLLRLNHFTVVVQNLEYGVDETDLNIAEQTGRVRDKPEADVLAELSHYGGSDRRSWLDAIQQSISYGAYPIVSIRIPSSKKPGTWGRHSVVALAFRGGMVTYFDPDKLSLERYGTDASNEGITRSDDDRLIYEQTRDKFLARMTGEVMHVFSPRAE